MWVKSPSSKCMFCFFLVSFYWCVNLFLWRFITAYIKTRESRKCSDCCCCVWRSAFPALLRDLLPLVVRQRDALRGHLEVHNSCSRWRNSSQCLSDGLGDCLRTSQGLHLQWVDIEHIACWEETMYSHCFLFN